jgi:transcription antitermination factor NusG
MSPIEQQFWFAIQVVPRREKLVSMLLNNKGYQSFVPIHRITKRWSDRSKVCESAIFPGYVFCLPQEQSYGLIVATPQVRRIVGFGGRPSPVTDAEIEVLKRLGNSATPAQSCDYPAVGQRVQVTFGPLAGVAGVLIQIKNKHRLVISIDAIMKSVSVSVDEVGILSPA